MTEGDKGFVKHFDFWDVCFGVRTKFYLKKNTFYFTPWQCLGISDNIEYSCYFF